VRWDDLADELTLCEE
jgi:hypothetical protein